MSLVFRHCVVEDLRYFADTVAANTVALTGIAFHISSRQRGAPPLLLKGRRKNNIAEKRNEQQAAAHINELEIGQLAGNKHFKSVCNSGLRGLNVKYK